MGAVTIEGVDQIQVSRSFSSQREFFEDELIAEHPYVTITFTALQPFAVPLSKVSIEELQRTMGQLAQGAPSRDDAEIDRLRGLLREALPVLDAAYRDPRAEYAANAADLIRRIREALGQEVAP